MFLQLQNFLYEILMILVWNTCADHISFLLKCFPGLWTWNTGWMVSISYSTGTQCPKTQRLGYHHVENLSGASYGNIFIVPNNILLCHVIIFGILFTVISLSLPYPHPLFLDILNLVNVLHLLLLSGFISNFHDILHVFKWRYWLDILWQTFVAAWGRGKQYQSSQSWYYRIPVEQLHQIFHITYDWSKSNFLLVLIFVVCPMSASL